MSTAITDRDEFARITKFAREAVDTAVGLGVLGLQRLQVGRVELQKRLAGHETLGAGYSALHEQALRRAGQADKLLTEALRTVESTLEPVTGRLPEPRPPRRHGGPKPHRRAARQGQPAPGRRRPSGRPGRIRGRGERRLITRRSPGPGDSPPPRRPGRALPGRVGRVRLS